MTVPDFTVLAESHFFHAGQRSTGLAFRMSVSTMAVAYEPKFGSTLIFRMSA